jgi:hypothetical protein
MKYTLFALLVVFGCTSVKAKDEPLCSAVYEPHLCLYKGYASYGPNKCEAIKKLQLELGAQIEKKELVCGKVHKLGPYEKQ